MWPALRYREPDNALLTQTAQLRCGVESVLFPELSDDALSPSHSRRKNKASLRLPQPNSPRIPVHGTRTTTQFAVTSSLPRENRGAIQAEMWEKWRLAYAQSAPGDVEAQIVEAHDPTVVFDRGNKLLITEHTLLILHDAVSWMAQQEGETQPATSYVQGLRSNIRQNYLKWPLEVRSSYAHITKDFPATQQYMLSVMSEADRQKFWAGEKEDHRVNPGIQTTAIASEMSTFYDLLVKAKMREYIQVSSWGIARQRARNLCSLSPTACVPF